MFTLRRNTISKLNFVPTVYYPNFKLVNKELMATCTKKGMKLVTVTAGGSADIRQVLDLGVDGIITNYPNRVLKHTRGY